MEATERRRFKGALKLLVLALALSRGEVHGYEVYKTIGELTGGRWRPSLGTIYRVMNEMVEEGLLEKRTSYEGRRQVGLYSPTVKGAAHFLESSTEYLRRIAIGVELVLEAASRLENMGLDPSRIYTLGTELLRILSQRLGPEAEGAPQDRQLNC